MEMVRKSAKVVSTTKGQTVQRAGFNALQRHLAVKTRHGCLAVWHRRSYFARVTIRRRATDCLCFAHIVQKRT